MSKIVSELNGSLFLHNVGSIDAFFESQTMPVEFVYLLALDPSTGKLEMARLEEDGKVVIVRHGDRLIEAILRGEVDIYIDEHGIELQHWQSIYEEAEDYDARAAAFYKWIETLPEDAVLVDTDDKRLTKAEAEEKFTKEYEEWREGNQESLVFLIGPPPDPNFSPPYEYDPDRVWIGGDVSLTPEGYLTAIQEAPDIHKLSDLLDDLETGWMLDKTEALAKEKGTTLFDLLPVFSDKTPTIEDVSEEEMLSWDDQWVLVGPLRGERHWYSYKDEGSEL